MMNIEEWLASETKDYGIGLALLGSRCKNRVLLQNLSRKQNPGKLEYELSKLHASGIESSVATVVAHPEPEHAKKLPYTKNPEKLIIVRHNREVKYEDLPEKLQTLWTANTDAYKLVRSLHEKLKLMENATDADRQPLVEKICQLDEAIRNNWAVIDAWQPGQEPEKEEQPVIDHKRINANRKYISTNVKKLGIIEGNQAVLLREKIQERVDELIAAGEVLKPDTLEELKGLGIVC